MYSRIRFVPVLFALVSATACGEIENNVEPDASPDAGPSSDGSSGIPNTLFVSTPDSLSNQSPAVFEFASDPPGADFECSLDGATATSCTSPLSVDVTDGEHTLEVTASNAGERDPTPESYTWTVDLTPPETTITSAPAALDNSVNVTFEFTASEDASFSCSVDGAAAVACTSPLEVTSLADGAHTFSVTATDLAGNPDPTPATHAWTVDTSSPDTQIDDGPVGDVASTGATFEFSSADAGPGATFECALDGGAFAACTSPHDLTGLSEGSHEFEVRVIDATGNQDPTPASRSWTVDLTPPTVAVTGGPTGATGDSTPTFTFTTGGAPTSVQCRIDSGAFASCTSPYTAAGLADGSHTFVVRATDAAGNSASDSRSFTVDTAGPTVSITAGPNGPTNDATPSFTFTTAGSPTSVQCRIDGGAFANCTSPFTSGSLADGSHSFEVRATDAAGNSSSDSRSFTVDTVAPTVTVVSGPSGPTSDTTPTFTFTTAGAPTTVECRVGGAYVACTSPYTSGALADGAQTFQVRVTDAAGNSSSDSRAFTVDTIAPTVTITSGPNGDTNDTTPTFTFTTAGAPTSVECRIGGAFAPCTSPYTSSALGDGARTFEVRVTDDAGNRNTASRAFTVDTVPPAVSILSGPNGPTPIAMPGFTFTTSGSPVSTQCRTDAGAYTNCTSPYTTASLSDGAHSVTVRVIDAAGNQDTDTRNFTVDTAPPTVTITSGPSGPISVNAPSFGFIYGGAPSSIQCRIGGGAFANCTSPYTSAPLADGSYTFEVRVTDPAGNWDFDTRSFTVDTVDPTVSIVSGPNGPTNTSTPVFGFTVGGSPTSVQCRVDGGAFVNCVSPYTTPQLADGNHTLEVRVTDAAGNSDNDTRSFSVDTDGPTVTIIRGPNGPTGDNTPTHYFDTTGSPSSVRCRIDSGSYYDCSSPHTSAALSDGPHTLYVLVADPAGNQDIDSRSFTVDTVDPTVSITGGPTGPTNNRTPTFYFTTGGSPTIVQCSIGGFTWTNCTSPYTSSTLNTGSYTFYVRVYDAAGNTTSDTRSFSIDYTPPTTTITSGPANGALLVNQSSVTFGFSHTGTTARCRLYRQGSTPTAYTTCTSPRTFGITTGNTYIFQVYSTDAAGNNSAVQTRSFQNQYLG